MRHLQELPGPRGLPLLGNLHQLDLKQMHRVLNQWCDEFGPVYKFGLGPRTVVVVADPEANQTILRSRPKSYRRLSTIEPVFREMGIAGVLSSEGEAWKRQRQLTAHALDTRHLQQFFPTLARVTGRLRSRWHRAAEVGESVNVLRDLMRYTVDVTTNLAFGYDMNTLEKEGDVIQVHLAMLLPMISRRTTAPFPYCRYFKLADDRSLDRSLAAIRETVNGFVASSRARLAAHPELAEHPTNLLEAMLAARDEENAAFTDEEVYGNAITMLLGGEDTTASTLAWIMHFMIEHPETQLRMKKEAVDVVGQGGMISDLQDTERLPFIEAVTQEAMRLKPVGPVIFLESLEDTSIGDAAIPKGTALMLLTMHGALQDTNFAAAQEFRPERWLPTDSPGAHNTRAFVPFGAGPRYCPGAQLGMLEIKAVMAMVCAGFDIVKPSDAPSVREVFAFTMAPQDLFLRFQRSSVAGEVRS